MSTYREILNFQIGNYSNYVNTHWWNIQESHFSFDEKNPSEICPDVLFREGKSLKGDQTFTPRTIVIDKKENSLNVPVLEEESLSRDSASEAVIWDANRISAETIVLPEKHEFIQDLEKMDKGETVPKKDYNFEDTVRTWCDFMRTRYHQKSLLLLNNFYQTDVFYFGAEIYKDVAELIEERARSYIEECNNIQGFHLSVDATDAYGGLGHQTLLHLQDLYPNKAVFAFPFIPSSYASGQRDDIQRMINILLCYQKLSEYCDVIIPLGTNKTAWRGLGPPLTFPNLTYDPKFYYQTSSILAAYLDTFSLKYRIRSDPSNLKDVASGLNFWNRKICAATLSLPFPIASNSYLLDTLEKLDETSRTLWNCLTPGCTIANDKIFYQRITIRGIAESRLRNPSSTRTDGQAYTCKSVPELLHLYLSFYVNTISDVTAVTAPLKTDVPFPRIFARNIGTNGSTEEANARAENSYVQSCPVLTGLHSCKDIGRMLESLHGNVKGINLKKYQKFFNGGMDLDEFNESLEKVLILGNEYVNDMDTL